MPERKRAWGKPKYAFKPGTDLQQGSTGFRQGKWITPTEWQPPCTIVRCCGAWLACIQRYTYCPVCGSAYKIDGTSAMNLYK